jgi:RNA polymerase sigma-70 factor (ECF subfamily)
MPGTGNSGETDARRELDRRLTAAMAKAQDGDRAAYEVVLRECVPIIRRVARNQGAGTDFLDDVVQDVLITVHGARQTFDPSRSFTAWLTVITQRRTIDLLRKRGRLGVREIHAPVAYETHAAPDNPAEQAELASEADRLRAAVATLPEGQREAVEKLALQEISLEDASKATGKTKTALKVNLHRAIRALRVRMRGDGGVPEDNN